MWRIQEHRRVDKQLSSAPREILKRYEKWKDIAMLPARPGCDSSRASMMKLCRESGRAIARPVSGFSGESFTAPCRKSNCFR